MKKKNILFILPDQLRWDYLGCYGAEFAKTPAIDCLAAEGVCYTNAISPSPLCVPARAAVLTGRNAIENGVLGNDTWLRPDHEACGVYTWPKILAKNGYETVAIGKMHFYPWDADEGFETRIISEDKRHVDVKDDYADALANRGLKKFRASDYPEYHAKKGAMKNPLPRECQADIWIAEQACSYLENRNDSRPFAMMVGFLSPHCPYDPDESLLDDFPIKKMPAPIPPTEESMQFHDRFLQDYRAEWAQLDYSEFTDEQKLTVKAYYSACIKDIDLAVKKLVDTLKRTNLYDDTVIIFSSDHGDLVGDFGMVAKHYFYEPSIHVPLIIRDPSFKVSGKKYTENVSLTDIRATILHIAGVKNPETSESRILSCYNQVNDDRTIFGCIDFGWMIRKGTWKYTCYNNGLEELHNMEKDPYEQRNLCKEPSYANLVKALRMELNAWVMQSILNANEEKTAGPAAASSMEDYSKRNWNRPYPYRAKKV